ncbi:MAG: hypothetical protein H6677_14165 [Candidatus Obscuribacterales bacterium]|nr:hypothetical protein [Candidatus Obscuribacterales bacterium]
MVAEREIDIGLLTARAFPELQSDYLPLVRELQARGYKVNPLVWQENRSEALRGFKNLIFCSVWDYQEDYQSFRQWLQEAESASNLINSARIIEWNIDKTYLKTLEKAEIPTIPTVWLDKGSPASLPEHCLDSKIVVIKPSIGAGSQGMKRFNLENETEKSEAIEHINALAQKTGVMIQPYLTSADETGEHALLYFGGRFSHAIHRPLAGHHAEPDEEVARVTAMEPSQEALAIGDKILATLPFQPAYMRVDLLLNEAGSYQLLELEMVEPSLFLAASPGSEKLYVDALEKGGYLAG